MHATVPVFNGAEGFIEVGEAHLTRNRNGLSTGSIAGGRFADLKFT